MSSSMARITTDLILAGFMFTILLILKNKSSHTPGMKVCGLAFKVVTTIIPVHIFITCLLIISTITGWIRTA